jgi:hypothetical protein
MSQQQANFADLLVSYYERTRAAAAARNIYHEGRTWKYSPLGTEFAFSVRDWPGEVKEIASGVDDLFVCYSVVEVASLAGFICEPDESTFWQDMGVVLESAFAADYLSGWLNLPLIRLLRSRLNGVKIALRDESDEITDSIMAFLDLDRRYRLAEGDAAFALMSAGLSRHGPQALTDLVNVCEDPQMFTDQLLSPPDERDKAGRDLHALSWLFGFCFELNELVDRLSRIPLLQAAVWSRYQYWLGNKALQFRNNVCLIHGLLESWLDTGKVSAEAGKEIENYTDRSWQVINALTSEQYALLLEKIATDASKLVDEKAGQQHSIPLVLDEPIPRFELAEEDWESGKQSHDQTLGMDA